MVEAPDHTRPSPDALLKAAEREGRGKLKIFLGAAPGVGKTYEMLVAARRRKAEGVDVVVGRRRDPWPRRDRGAARRAGGRAAAQGRVQGPHARGDGHRRHPEAPPAARAGRRARPYQRRGQPPSQALHGCRGAARRRHRRLFDAERPAHREPERRGGAHHPHPRARDRARPHLRCGGRHRAGRSHAGRPDPSPERGQGLRPRAGAARAAPLLLARQPDGVARAGAAAHRRARRRPDAELHARARHHGPVGRRRARDRLPRSQPGRRQCRARRQAHGGRPRCRADRALCRDRPARDRCPRPSAAISPRRCGSPSGWARRS